LCWKYDAKGSDRLAAQNNRQTINYTKKQNGDHAQKQKEQIRQRRKRELQRKRLKKQQRAGMTAVVFIVALFCVIVSIGSYGLYQKNLEYEEQIAELQKQIDEAEEYSTYLDDFAAYVKTDDYIREIARSKFGLVYPNEIMFIEKD
jgi:cell division protein DivIC